MSIENNVRIRKVKTDLEPDEDIYVVDVLVDVTPWWRRWLCLSQSWAWKPLRLHDFGGLSALFGVNSYSPCGNGDVKIFEDYDSAQDAVDQIVENYRIAKLQDELKGN